MRLKIGDSVGLIQKVLSDSQGRQNYWRLVEAEITSIRINKNGAKYYAPKRFHPLDVEEVDDNTDIMENANGYILAREVFGLNNITRPKAEQWVKWANDNPDRVAGVMEDEGGLTGYRN